MRSFGEYNPIAVAVYFLLTAGIAMFCLNPILLALSLTGAMLLFRFRQGGGHWRSYLGYLGLFVLMTLLNPLLSHNGVTVLFVLNGAPITAEAVLYGAVSAIMVIGTLCWFRSFTEIMKSDKLLYLFGALSPRLALIFSMALRYVPLFAKQTAKVQRTQTALGLYQEDNLVDRTKGGLRICSVMVTWALENGIITADSMAARGYGIGRRSRFSDFRFRRGDVLLLAAVLGLSALTLIAMGLGALDFECYPAIRFSPPSAWTGVGYISYGILTLLPAILEGKERIKWKYLESKI